MIIKLPFWHKSFGKVLRQTAHNFHISLAQFISYTEDVSTLFQRHQIRYYLYADDKQAYTDVPVEDVSSARRVLRDCISDVANWCSSRRFQLSASKSELIWFGSRFSLKQLRMT